MGSVNQFGIGAAFKFWGLTEGQPLKLYLVVDSGIDEFVAIMTGFKFGYEMFKARRLIVGCASTQSQACTV